MLIPAGTYLSLIASFRSSARFMYPRSAGGRSLILPGSLLDALPGQGHNRHTVQCHPEKDCEDTIINLKGPVVVGGAVLDCVIHIEDDNLKLDGRTVVAAAGARAAGGVARNVAAALALLGTTPRLLTALGDDAAGRLVLASLPRAVDARSVLVQRGGRTPVYAALLGAQGVVRLGLADMKMHTRGLAASRLLPALRPLLAPAAGSGAATAAPLVVVDGNPPADALLALLRLCHDLRVPVWFEPTDVHKAAKPFETDIWKTIAFASPNLNELRTMVTAAGCHVDELVNTSPEGEAWMLSKRIIEHSPMLTLIVTLGPRGVLVVRRAGPEDSMLYRQESEVGSSVLQARLYPAKTAPNDVMLCESGAGDCLAAGVIAAALRGCTETQSLAVGLDAALTSLVCPYAVPDYFPNIRFESEAPYQCIN